MTKQQVIDLTGRSVYLIWLQIAMETFDERDPQSCFIRADNFIKELLKQAPDF